MTQRNIYFFQPGHYTVFQGHRSYWLPYSVGCLWSYASQDAAIRENFCARDFVFRREKIDQLLDRITDPQVALFSSYIWNFGYNLAAAEAIKKRWPECAVVFGGPQVTVRPLENRFFQHYPFIDATVNGEGEQAFSDICHRILAGESIPRQLKAQRLQDVSYPSPYSGGVFDKLIADNPDLHWQVTLETNRGCPYRCTFCDWGSATYSKITRVPEQRVISDIEWCGRNAVDYVYIADANFGILYERDLAFATKINEVQRTTGRPKVVIAQWAKNSQEKILDIARIFFQDHNRGFTLSVQSMDDTVLDAIKRRNMETSDMRRMLELCEQQGLHAYTELMLGLPHETRDTWRDNHWRLLEIGQHNSVDVWMTQLLENSALNTPEQRTEHEIESVLVPRYITGVVVDEEDVPEQEYLIRSTKYMSMEHMIDSFIFSAMIVHFHYLIGATQIISRVLHKMNLVTYRDFYERLEHYIKNQQGWIAEPYKRLGEFLPRYLNGQDTGDAELARYFHSGIWIVGKTFFQDIDRTMLAVRDMCDQKWTGLDAHIYEQLMDFQDRYVVRWNKKCYPQRQRYNYDFMGFIQGGDLYRSVVTNFDYHHDWQDMNSYLERAYHDRRTRDIINAKIHNEPVN